MMRTLFHYRGFGYWVAALALSVLAGCSSVDVPRQTRTGDQQAVASTPVTLLAFGDSGYHYDYMEPKDYETLVTEQQFLAKEHRDWARYKRPPEEFAHPPTYLLPPLGSVVDASGLAPVAKAMKDFCAHSGCDFATMLGDNIYPDGATANADGRDAARFRDLFMTPFAPLAGGREQFRIYTVLGNHDWRTSREGAMAQVKFLETTPPFFMDGLFYRVKPAAAHGEVEIFALDTEMLLASTTVYKAQLADDASEIRHERVEAPLPWTVPQSAAEQDMARWLEDALRTSTARWKIVIGHHPLWSGAGSKFEQANSLRRLILPALCKYADAYVAGHEHTLEVHTDDCSVAMPGERMDPLPQVVSGSAAKMRPTNSAFIRQQLKAYPELHTLYAKGLVWGFAHLTFERDRMIVRIVETPDDGSGATQVAYEHSFARRAHRGAP